MTRCIVELDMVYRGGWASEYHLLRVLLYGEYIFGCWDHIEKSKKGYHFIKHNLPSKKSVLTLRHLLGDDPTRILFDEMQDSKPFNILWTEKNNIQNVEPIDRDNILALPFRSKNLIS